MLGTFLLVPIFHKDCMNMSFHGNQRADIAAISLHKTFYSHSKWNKMKRFWKILSMTFGFYKKKLVQNDNITIIHIFTHVSLILEY